MTVNQDFPFECCEKCKSIRPYTNKQILYSAEEVVDIELSIGCENEQQCLELRKMILNETMMVEPKTGHWIYKEYDDMFMCSSCEKYSIQNNYPYCHWCGAKMKQEGR